MFSKNQLDDYMSVILLCGLFIACILVIIGGTVFLIHYGHQNMHSGMLIASHYNTTIKEIFISAANFSPLGIIELGLLALVMTQVCRVIILVFYYQSIQDYKFLLISAFILLTLIYSIFLR